MKVQVYLFLGTGLSCFPVLAFGQCVVTEDCAVLGYTASSCPGKGLKCPFGNGWFCAGDESSICAENGFKYSCTGTGYAGGAGFACGGKYTQCNCTTKYAWNGSSCALSCSSAYQYTCTGTGYAGGAGSACGGKYAQCTCASGYEWKNGACQPKGSDYSLCKVGTLFYSDGTCSNEKINDKTLLGVVVYEKTASESGWVMMVESLGLNIAWGIYNTSTGVREQAAGASCTNTQKLVALGSRFAAANKANSYNVGGKKWCLPSYDVLNNINNQTNFTKVNAGIAIAGGTKLGAASSYYEYIWSSSEIDSIFAWCFKTDITGSFSIGKCNKVAGGSDSVRLVFAF